MKKLFIVILLFFSLSAWTQNTLDEKKKLEFDENFFDAMNERLKNNYEKSNEYFEQCLSIDDQNDAIYFKMAQNYLDAKNYEKAFQYLEQARRINPENKWYQKLFIDIKIESGAPRDEIKKLIKKFEPVAQNKYVIRALTRKMYRKTSATNQSKPVKKENTSREGNHLAQLWQQKNYQALAKAAEKKLDDEPDNPQIYLYVARAYTGLNQPEKALEFLEMGSDFIVGDKKMQKSYYQQYIKVYQLLDKPKKVKLYQQKLEKI